MTRALRTSAAALVGVLALSLAACGGDEDGDTAGDTTAKAGASKAPAGDDFCGQLKANGADGSPFSAIQTYLPKDALLADVDAALALMGDATPPADLAPDWTLRQDHLTALEAAAEAAPAGGRVDDPALLSDEKVNAANQRLSDYWFDTCQ